MLLYLWPPKIRFFWKGSWLVYLSSISLNGQKSKALVDCLQILPESKVSTYRVGRYTSDCMHAMRQTKVRLHHRDRHRGISTSVPKQCRVGWGNLSLVFGLPSYENFKLTTRGKIVVPLPQMVLPLNISVQFLTDLGFH